MAQVRTLLSPAQISALVEAGRRFNASIGEALRELNKQLLAAHRRRLMQRVADPLVMAEAIKQTQYERRIATEHRLARAYLRQIVAAEERRLGLRPEFDPRRKER